MGIGFSDLTLFSTEGRGERLTGERVIGFSALVIDHHIFFQAKFPETLPVGENYI
jgi:hypothetical protein